MTKTWQNPSSYYFLSLHTIKKHHHHRLPLLALPPSMGKVMMSNYERCHSQLHIPWEFFKTRSWAKVFLSPKAMGRRNGLERCTVCSCHSRHYLHHTWKKRTRHLQCCLYVYKKVNITQIYSEVFESALHWHIQSIKHICHQLWWKSISAISYLYNHTGYQVETQTWKSPQVDFQHLQHTYNPHCWNHIHLSDSHSKDLGLCSTMVGYS